MRQKPREPLQLTSSFYKYEELFILSATVIAIAIAIARVIAIRYYCYRYCYFSWRFDPSIYLVFLLLSTLLSLLLLLLSLLFATTFGIDHSCIAVPGFAIDLALDIPTCPFALALLLLLTLLSLLLLLETQDISQSQWNKKQLLKKSTYWCYFMTKIIDACLKECYFLYSWKKANNCNK
ncbi:hypothetical protein GQX74_004553 [Glossina fuscipes]|nr:hypothetical protein GQX74_004553 [Glossina fuscipes]